MLFLKITLFLPYITHNSYLILLLRSSTQHSTLMSAPQRKLIPGAPSTDNLLHSKIGPLVWVQFKNIAKY